MGELFLAQSPFEFAAFDGGYGRLLGLGWRRGVAGGGEDWAGAWSKAWVGLLAGLGGLLGITGIVCGLSFRGEIGG